MGSSRSLLFLIMAILQVRKFEGSLVSSWSFNGDLSDSSVYSNTLQGNNVEFLTTTAFQSILWGQYAHVAGDNSYARRVDFDFMVSNGEFTVEFWVKIDSQQYNIFTFANLTTTFLQFWNVGSQAGCQFEIGGEFPVIPDALCTALQSNSWHHVAIVGNFTEILWYLDGNFEGSSSLQSNHSIPGVGNLTIGFNSDLANFSAGTSQSMSDFRMWNTARIRGVGTSKRI
ncbi:hypothetical protein GUITHDRAFT_143990 [Guillardia theta CCMP2712]|uniref:LamG-like jellyroll fold domain-containing protein n=1 Tax=Guillardia theta (strain CCMP2712) TaxID=905079 RepID=L1ISL8_GUITC|nr:hypothetical protein GUITHDRAFT_143990 [Guillardia theta CCMP2712]EKX38805.1 hypothetical protein GUITHDRAFT_143990 [Guillardia theta CCMP2712]|eukprot:XP_005825785.1 hypothetical protein GUITHDRAFT_143990 [Guillardia theta CCMP2712]